MLSLPPCKTSALAGSEHWNATSSPAHPAAACSALPGFYHAYTTHGDAHQLLSCIQDIVAGFGGGGSGEGLGADGARVRLYLTGAAADRGASFYNACLQLACQAECKHRARRCLGE
jgi:hypothetical protein